MVTEKCPKMQEAIYSQCLVCLILRLQKQQYYIAFLPYSVNLGPGKCVTVIAAYLLLRERKAWKAVS